MIESLTARALTYELDFDEEHWSHIKPKMSITCDATTTSNKELYVEKGKPVFDKDLHIKRRDKGEIKIEVWDTGMPEAGTLLAKGYYVFHHLQNKEGTFQEWVPLKNDHGKEIGRALLEITISPQSCDIPLDDTPQHMIEELDQGLKKKLGLSGEQNELLE